MEKLYLSKKLIVGHHLIVSPSWISNGCWAVRRKFIADSILYDTYELAVAHFRWLTPYRYGNKTDEEMEGVIHREGLEEYLRSEWSFKNGVVFRNANNTDCIAFDSDWIDKFKIERLMVPVEDKLRNPSLIIEDGEVSLGIMPNRWTEDVGETLFDLERQKEER